RGVLFLSYCRFWERHGFVQQSLAQKLARSGVKVVWLDGAGWRNYDPVIVDPVRTLKVAQLPALPMRRLPVVSHWDLKGKMAFLRRRIRRLGGNPIIWVQAGIDERLAAELPYIDVFSVFDDPYRHAWGGALCNKAKIIVTQNGTAQNVLLPAHETKAHRIWPPVDMDDGSMRSQAEVFLPPGFPERTMGYVGSFFSDGFDLDLFEHFIQKFPDWGFLLMGRTDAAGLERMRGFKRYKNFHYFPWVPRDQVAAVWRKIHLTLLFYKPNPTQDGAFPVKIVEGLKFGAPCLATAVPKTADLEGIFPRSNDAEELVASVESAIQMPKEKLAEYYDRFQREMNPTNHLIRVAQWLR
ncbi:glycosyltransferase, partial [bacterium]|nr:glycosyltransferase [bacterium]